jgi:hypothetical protein
LALEPVARWCRQILQRGCCLMISIDEDHPLDGTAELDCLLREG